MLSPCTLLMNVSLKLHAFALQAQFSKMFDVYVNNERII